MFLQLFFKRWSLSKQADYMKRRGIVLGTRQKGGRQSYLHMVNNLFAEILYEDDNPGLKAEALVVIHGLTELHRHLEQDIRNL